MCFLQSGETSTSLIIPVTLIGKSSSWVTLSRSFINVCIIGWDNLPRTVLIYFNNVMLPQEGYFHSVVCNAPEFRNTTVNSDLRYMVWDNPPKMEPHFLNKSDFDQMVQSGSAFARRFHKDDPVLTMIDNKILKRRQHRVAPGAWCAGRDTVFTDVFSHWVITSINKPGSKSALIKNSRQITSLVTLFLFVQVTSLFL